MRNVAFANVTKSVPFLLLFNCIIKMFLVQLTRIALIYQSIYNI